MINHKCEYKVFNIRDIINEFCDITGWKCLYYYGYYNIKNDNPTSFDLEFTGYNVYQHSGQDYMYIDAPGDEYCDEEISLEYIIKNSEVEQYNDTNYIIVHFGFITDYLRLNNKLPKESILCISG